MQVQVPRAPREGRRLEPGEAVREYSPACWVIAGLLSFWLPPPPRRSIRPANIPDLKERSGLMMRFAGRTEILPPDPLRDNFYNTRYADRGLIKHPDGIKDQGLYGLGWKTACTESVYPFLHGDLRYREGESSPPSLASLAPGTCRV